ncbi:MAG: tetratricopeptide repeat protein [Acidobacteriota bacterium]|nr:tetratricopeptide repeat protein [Acidobacteriota bacterium]
MAPALILAAVLLAYFNSFGGAFQFDDYNVIVDNGRVHGLAAWLGDLGGIRPLLKLSYALNWMAGPGPWGFHLVNLAIHGANGVLAFTLLKRLSAGNEDTGLVVLSAALIFVLHPVQTEAVTYICGRSTSLMALFYLASLVAFIRSRETASKPWNLFSALLFLLACLTKETALTLPLALVLLERASGRWNGLAQALRATSAHWLLLCIIGTGLVLHPVQRALLATSFSTRGIPMNLLNQVQALGYLLRAWCWPAHLNIDPFLPQATRLTWPMAGMAALWLGVLGLGLFSLRSRPWLGFGLLWFFLHLIPTNSFIPRLDLVNERQLYLPSLGLALVLASAARNFIRRTNLDRKIVVTGALVILTALGTRTLLRNRDYQSEVALWRSSVQEAPQNPRAHNNMGYAYLLQGNKEQARRAFETALALDPGYAKARANLDSLKLDGAGH